MQKKNMLKIASSLIYAEKKRYNIIYKAATFLLQY